MVDYAKWDNMNVSSDEEEPARPRVTRVGEPGKASTVTFGAGHGGHPSFFVAEPVPHPQQLPARVVAEAEAICAEKLTGEPKAKDYSTNYSQWDNLDVRYRSRAAGRGGGLKL